MARKGTFRLCHLHQGLWFVRTTQLVLVLLFLPFAFKLRKATPRRMRMSSSILTFERPYEMVNLCKLLVSGSSLDSFKIALNWRRPWMKNKRKCFELWRPMRLSRRRNLTCLDNAGSTMSRNVRR
ncbi:hypothetical protein EV401DRAFT_2016383 [Pisolithus croceorrhizus]|nr:hypothetical protein EV401DRAFT_2016383 [Pisolithus croceorrhizus]